MGKPVRSHDFRTFLFRAMATLSRARKVHFSKIIGPVVLGAGILSVLMVIWLALPPAPPPDVVSLLEMQKEWEASQPTTAQLAARAAGTDLARGMEGLWIAKLTEGVASLTVAGGVFQILYYPPVGTLSRRYVRGVIEVKHGLAILTPRDDLGAPDPVIVDGRFFPYEVLTRRVFAIQAEREGEKLIWKKGAPTVSNVHGEESFHPLFDLAVEGRLVWEPIPDDPEKSPEPSGGEPAGMSE